MARTFVLCREDINSELHPHLWHNILVELGVSTEAEQITLELSRLDDNKKVED